MDHVLVVTLTMDNNYSNHGLTCFSMDLTAYLAPVTRCLHCLTTPQGPLHMTEMNVVDRACIDMLQVTKVGGATLLQLAP